MCKRVGIPLFVLALAACCLVSAGTAPSVRAATTHVAGVKRITISLSRQRLRAWVGNTVVLSTPVTTGDAVLPTPTGYFTIFAKRSPYTFISPFPAGSRFWYPPSTVSFAMEFANGGYFIHDAPWRTAYGRGTNAGSQPGTNYGGTHGCVNVPYNAARFLYFWAPIGTSVHVVP
jgi:lipoprotein-anchoring transpeptidase ErfK/SrfK